MHMFCSATLFIANLKVKSRLVTLHKLSFKILVLVHVAAYSFSCQGNGTCDHRLAFSIVNTSKKTKKMHGRKETNFS